AQPIVDAIKACLGDGGSALGPAFEATARAGEGEIAQRIQRILEDEIRPAVAMDGGDIVFAGFHDGRVELYMQGSCSGCPSPTATLKMGNEARPREEIPEVQEVVALERHCRVRCPPRAARRRVQKMIQRPARGRGREAPPRVDRSVAAEDSLWRRTQRERRMRMTRRGRVTIATVVTGAAVALIWLLEPHEAVRAFGITQPMPDFDT